MHVLFPSNSVRSPRWYSTLYKNGNSRHGCKFYYQAHALSSRGVAVEISAQTRARTVQCLEYFNSLCELELWISYIAFKRGNHDCSLQEIRKVGLSFIPGLYIILPVFAMAIKTISALQLGKKRDFPPTRLLCFFQTGTKWQRNSRGICRRSNDDNQHFG